MASSLPFGGYYTAARQQRLLEAVLQARPAHGRLIPSIRLVQPWRPRGRVQVRQEDVELRLVEQLRQAMVLAAVFGSPDHAQRRLVDLEGTMG